jgi:hypothetical protein
VPSPGMIGSGIVAMQRPVRLFSSNAEHPALSRSRSLFFALSAMFNSDVFRQQALFLTKYRPRGCREADCCAETDVLTPDVLYAASAPADYEPAPSGSVEAQRTTRKKKKKKPF